MTADPILEREAELAVLAAAVDAARRRPGAFILVEGSAGIGKSTLLARAKQLAHDAGRSVLSANGSEMDKEFSFGVVRQLFEPALREAGDDRRAALLTGAARPAAAALGADLAADVSAGDFAILHGLFWLTANLAEERGLAVIVDDLQWADAGSLRFLAHLLPRFDDLDVSLIVGLRPHEPDTDWHMISQIISHPNCVVVRPGPLSMAAAAAVISNEYAAAPGPSAQPHHDFVAMCHQATDGNPLLLHELSRTLVSEGVDPRQANPARINETGARAVTRRVALWMSKLSADSISLAHAVAVLGDGAALGHAAELAGLPQPAAASAMTELEQTEILVLNPSPTGQQLLRFVHPLIREAVYETISSDQRGRAHSAAAGILDRDPRVDAEQVAAHLLRTFAAGDPGRVTVLREAAGSALARGCPDIAVTYLRRAREEPPLETELPDVLAELATAALLVDAGGAVGYLTDALELATEPVVRAELTARLGGAQLILRRSEEALRTWTQALQEVPEGDSDLRRRLQAGILSIPMVEPGRMDLRRGILLQVPALRALRPAATVGGRALDCMLAGHESITGDPRSVARATRAVSDGLLIAADNGGYPLAVAWLVLLSADHPLAMTSVDAAVAEAYARGSTHSLTGALTYRAAAWLNRGNLAEAETDAREAVRLLGDIRNDLRRLVLSPIYAHTLMAQGRLEEAQAALDAVSYPRPISGFGFTYFQLLAQARLLRLRGKLDAALETALDAGRSFIAAGGHNPGTVAWQSEAALCLGHDPARARAFAESEVQLARRWTAPRSLGRALRVLAGTLPPNERLSVLREAVARLEDSSARLELAETLADLGAELLRLNERQDAVPELAKALDIAEVCGAVPLADRLRTLIESVGVSPRRTALTGPDALTPSERRVAELASAGTSNREVAQQLFVTVKTVEVHLTNVYRKLGIARRGQLAASLHAHDAG